MTTLLDRALARARQLPAAQQDEIARMMLTHPGLAAGASGQVDPQTRRAVDAFLRHLDGRYPIREAILFGSRARQTHTHESDADLALVLDQEKGDRMKVGLHMADVAFDVLMETEVLIQPLPLWATEYESPETFNNPALIEAIRRDGLRM